MLHAVPLRGDAPTQLRERWDGPERVPSPSPRAAAALAEEEATVAAVVALLKGERAAVAESGECLVVAVGLA